MIRPRGRGAAGLRGDGAHPARRWGRGTGVRRACRRFIFLRRAHAQTARPLLHAALERATQAARGQDIRLGGVATPRQYLRVGLVDEMHVAIVPLLLGAGEALFAGIDLPILGFRCVEHVATPSATHMVLRKAA